MGGWGGCVGWMGGGMGAGVYVGLWGGNTDEPGIRTLLSSNYTACISMATWHTRKSLRFLISQVKKTGISKNIYPALSIFLELPQLMFFCQIYDNSHQSWSNQQTSNMKAVSESSFPPTKEFNLGVCGWSLCCQLFKLVLDGNNVWWSIFSDGNTNYSQIIHYLRCVGLLQQLRWYW